LRSCHPFTIGRCRATLRPRPCRRLEATAVTNGSDGQGSTVAPETLTTTDGAAAAERTSSRSSPAATTNTKIVVDLSSGDNNARAGRDGYSLLRQPLQRDTWDTTKDPRFQAPKALDSGDASTTTKRQDAEWWSSRQQQQQRGASTPQGSPWGEGESVGGRGAAGSSEEDTPPGRSLNLFQRSFDTLDFPLVLRALRAECSTIPAKQIVDEAADQHGSVVSATAAIPDPRGREHRGQGTIKKEPLIADSPESVQDRYQAVQEMQWLLDPSVDLGDAYYKTRRGYQMTIGQGNPPPLEGHAYDLDSVLQIAERGQVLEGPELLDVLIMMNSMEDLQLWSKGLEYATVRNRDQQQFQDGETSFVQLPNTVQGIELNSTLQRLLEDAFDAEGKLSGKTFPVLGELRAKIRTLKADILETLDRLVTLPSVQSKLALESGGPLISEVSSAGGGGRLVLPIDPRYASDLGIVHDASRSGKTVYVEPSEVVSPTNDLRQIERELEAEEAKVWRSLTEQVWTNRRDLQASVHAVAQLDLCVARCALAKRLRGVIPIVRNDGVISLQDAKHPVLLLRKAEQVVGSDINLGADGNQGLVLTGPNAGGT
jgi:hypothetical protein